jgi:hypothetical protein
VNVGLGMCAAANRDCWKDCVVRLSACDSCDLSSGLKAAWIERERGGRRSRLLERLCLCPPSPLQIWKLVCMA